MRSKARTMGQIRARNATGPFSWKSALLFVLTGAGMIVYFRVEKDRLERKRIAEMSKGVGKPKVGGPFVLKDLEGKVFTEEELKGRYSFVSLLFQVGDILDWIYWRWTTGSLNDCCAIGLLRFHALPRYLPGRAGQDGRDY
jgi:hypothetical protein